MNRRCLYGPGILQTHTPQFRRLSEDSLSIWPSEQFNRIKEWLDDIDICFTTGTANLNWKSIMPTIKGDHRFYLDTDDDGVLKPAGWEFLKMEGSDDEDEDEEEAGDSNYSGASDDDDDESESSESDCSDWESIVDKDSSDDEPSEEEEDAPSWDELEKEAQASDRMRNEKRGHEDEDEDYRRSPKKKKSRRH